MHTHVYVIVVVGFWFFFYLQDLILNTLKIFFISSLSLFQAMSTILDKQSMLFIDTADMLARMSRESLVKAR